MSGRQYNPDPRARAKALEIAHANGRAGATRLGDEVLFATGFDPSDTFIGLAFDHLEAGRRERDSQPDEEAA
jgi:hypothetical protein